MDDAVFLLILGALIVVYAVWWIPRRMEALKERPETDERFDRVLQSRGYRVARVAIAVVGVAALANGVYLALS